MTESERPPTKEELLEKAKQPAKDAMVLHPFYRGKIQTIPKCVIRGYQDFAIWYTPGVAKPCLDIRVNHDKVWEHTNRGNLIAVVSDGSRVLGLGNIGPEASLPVMEGKSNYLCSDNLVSHLKEGIQCPKLLRVSLVL